MASTRLVRLLFARLLAAPEHCGDAVAQAQIRMVDAGTLRNTAEFVLRCQAGISGGGQRIKDTVFGIQEYSNLILFGYLLQGIYSI